MHKYTRYYGGFSGRESFVLATINYHRENDLEKKKLFDRNFKLEIKDKTGITNKTGKLILDKKKFELNKDYFKHAKIIKNEHQEKFKHIFNKEHINYSNEHQISSELIKDIVYLPKIIMSKDCQKK